MRSWYEFGFSGFPTGEQRRRFYRQRDDPCDSEEECDYDDETNDRPVIRYPLRASEEGSRTSDDSGWSSDTSSASDAPAPTGTGGARFHAAQVSHHHHHRHRRSRRTRRAVREGDATARCVLHSTLNEDMPAWYGATTVLLATAGAGGLPAADVLSLQHGGAPCASPTSVSAHVSLWHWVALGGTAPAAAAGAASGGGVTRDEVTGSLRCTRVPDDASLLTRLCWERVHPALRLAHSSATPPPPRLGHCAVALTDLDSALLRFFLADPHSTDAAATTRAASTFRSGTLNSSSSNVGVPTTTSTAANGVLLDSDIQVSASLILGGASQLVHVSGRDAFSPSSSPYDEQGVCHHSHPSPTPVAAPRQINLDHASLPRASLLSHPTLCLTLWTTAGRGGDGGDDKTATPALRHHSLFLPLDTPSMSITAARAFASLTPWADRAAGASATCAFAYLGGTDNGRDPLTFMELEIFRLHLDTWTWSCTPVTTYGATPAPRFGHSASMVDVDGGGKEGGEGFLVMFGGIGGGRAYLNDLHVLDVHTRVWREVFMPSGLGIARRAFHMAAVLRSPCSPQNRTRGASTAASSTAPPQLSTFAVQSRLALQLQEQQDEDGGAFLLPLGSTGGQLGGTSGVGEEEAQDDADLAVWSSSVTTAHSHSTLLLLGGECEGRPVATSWACLLRNGKWQRLSFPLRTLPPFFHVAAPLAAGGCGDGGAAAAASEAWRVRRQLPRADFRAAVESMVERTAPGVAEAALTDALTAGTAGDAYVAACHGSLSQVLVVHGSRRLLLVGGSRGPPVSIATQVEAMGTTLKDTTSLWLLAAQQQGPMSDAVLSRVPNVQRFFFRHNSALSRAVGSVMQPSDAMAEQRRRPLSEAEVRSNRVVSESVLDGQLTEWMRLARKRLRDTS